MVEKFSNFEKNRKKIDPISALFSTQRPPDDWPDSLDHLAIGLVADKYTKLFKTCETLLLSLGLFYHENTTVLCTGTEISMDYLSQH